MKTKTLHPPTVSQGLSTNGPLSSFFSAIVACAKGTLHWNASYIAPDSKPWKQTPLQGQMPLHYRISYYVLTVLISVLATFAYGAAIARSRSDLNFWQGGLAMLAIAGPGWVIQASLALAVRGKSALEYLSHMTTTMWQGTIPLAALAIVVLILGPVSPTWFIVAVGISSLFMARTHYRRVHSLGLSQTWTLTWFLILQLTAWGAIAASADVQHILDWQ